MPPSDPPDTDDPGAAVPVAFAKTRPKPVETEVRPFDFARLRGRKVDVRASGFTYRGVLMGADENELYLRSETRWVVLPLDRIAQVRIDEEAERAETAPSAAREDASSSEAPTPGDEGGSASGSSGSEKP